jgi:hypothetical protein
MRRRKSYALRVAVLVGALLMSGLGGSTAAGASPDAAETAARPKAAAGVERAAAPAAPAAPTAPTQAGEQQTRVRYGPYSIDAAPENPDGTHGHAHSGNQFAINVQKPCTNCYITRMQADLVKADGTRAGFSNNLQLHHMVLFNRDTGRQDATCPSSLGLLGQRFFASGDERSPVTFPAGYGYRVSSASSWILIWDLASMSGARETVYYQVDFEWVPASTPNMRDVEPVWFDVDQCGDSQVNIPVGPSQQRYTWTVNRPGELISIGGHLHDHGIDLAIRNDTTGQLLCTSRAGYGETPLYVDHHGEEHISSMSGCGGEGTTTPVGTFTNGQRITITSRYDSPIATNDAMGIAVGYVAQPGGGGGGGGSSCVRAANSAHVQAGRATQWLVFVFAAGTGQYLGLTSQTTSLQQGTSPSSWSMVAAC